MEDHKRRILEAWREHPSAFGVPTTDLLGGARVRRQVLDLLRANVTLASKEYEMACEREQGRVWWKLYIEGPADEELLTTLSLAVKRRANEPEADYLARLRRIEREMRARLPDYIREPPRGAERRIWA